MGRAPGQSLLQADFLEFVDQERDCVRTGSADQRRENRAEIRSFGGLGDEAFGLGRKEIAIFEVGFPHGVGDDSGEAVGDLLVRRDVRGHDGLLEWLHDILTASAPRPTLGGQIFLEALPEEISLVRHRQVRAGELPDELGEVLAADGSQQRVGEIVEVHAGVVEVERLDPLAGKQAVVKPVKQAGFACSVVAENYENLRSGRMMTGFDEIAQPFGEGVGRRDRDSDGRTGRRRFERVEGEVEPGQHVRHDGVLRGGRRR